MTLYKIRERFEGFSIRVGIVFGKLGLSPNAWTMSTIIPTLIALHFLLRKDFILAGAFFLAAAFFDLIDGSVARVTGRVSKLGAYLDTIVDRYVEFLIVLGLMFAQLPPVWIATEVWLLTYLFGGMMTTYAKAAAKEKGLVEKELRGGVMERAERLIVLFIGILLASTKPAYLSYVIVLLAIATNISAIQRIIAATGKSKS